MLLKEILKPSLIKEATKSVDQQYRNQAEKTLSNIVMAVRNNSIKTYVLNDTEDEISFNISGYISTDVNPDEIFILSISFEENNENVASLTPNQHSSDIIHLILRTEEPKPTDENELFQKIYTLLSQELTIPFIHELIHLFDMLRREGFFDDTPSGDSDEEYYNHPSELNAYFQEAMWNFMDYVESHESSGRPLPFNLDNFQDSWNFFTNQALSKPFWNHLTQENQRRIQKRFYQTWSEL